MDSLLGGYLESVYTTLNCNLKRVLWKSLQPFYFWDNLEVIPEAPSTSKLSSTVTCLNGIRCIMLCGIFWLGWLMDVGRYEGVAPSMSQKGSLMLKKQKYGGKTTRKDIRAIPRRDVFINAHQRARVGAKRSPRLVALGSPPWGDTTGRHNGETQRGDTTGRQRGERKEGTKRKSKMKNVTFIVCKPKKLLCNRLKC